MARPKKPTYEYVPSLKQYRKRIKDADGKSVAIYGKTPEILTEKIKEAEARIAANLEAGKSPTVKQYAERWLELNDVNSTYARCLRTRALPVIGDKKLAEIKPDDAKAVMAKVSVMSRDLQTKTLNVMKNMFEDAVDNGWINSNPCRRLKPGGAPPKEKPALTPGQEKILLDAVRGTGAETFCMIGLYAGLRREEILALQWDCVNLGEHPYIEVKRALRWEHNRPVVSDDLKSQRSAKDASRRKVAIPSVLADHLRSIQNESEFVLGRAMTQTAFKNMWRIVERRQAGETTARRIVDGEMVKAPVTREVGEVSRNHSVTRTIDFEVTPHILRHTYSTRLLLGGVDLKRVQYLMGHADSRITIDRYTHLVEQDLDGMADVVNNVFGG